MATSWPGTAYTRTDLVDGDGNDYPQADDINLPANETVAMQPHFGCGRWTNDPTASGGVSYGLKEPGGSNVVGYAANFAGEDVDDTLLTLIPNGSEDVTAILVFTFCVKASTGDVDYGTMGLAPGDSENIFDDGTNVLEAAVSAVGAFTLQRTAGTATFDAIIPSAGWI